MPSYLVETFLARDAAAERAIREERAGEAAEALTRDGTRVRFAGSIHVPQDEVCFFRFDASSETDAALAARLAGLKDFRVVEIDGRMEGSETTSQ